MSGFTSSERIQADQHVKVLARALHDLSPAYAETLRQLMLRAERQSPDITLARLLVAESLMRGILSNERAPVRTGQDALPAALCAIFDEARALGHALQPYAIARHGGMLRFFGRSRPRLSRSAQQALLHCKVILAASQRRDRQAAASASSPILRTA